MTQQAKAMIGVTGQNKVFRDDFPGSALDLSLWEVVQTGDGQTVTVGSSALTITTGTTNGAETIIKSLVSFEIPIKLMVALTLSQRIANQIFYIELINSSGDQYARWLFDGTSATTGKTETRNKDTSDGPTNRSIISTATASGVLDIDLTYIDALFETININSVLSPTSFSHTQKLPNPNEKYYIQIRAKNTGTAASTTSLVIDHVLVIDTSTIYTELIGGRGGSANRGLSVNVNNTTSTSIPAQGAVAHDAAASTNPFMVAGEARMTNAVVSASGDCARLITDKTRRQVVMLGNVPELNQWSQVILTGTSETTLIAAVASVRWELWDVVVANLSAANVVQVDFRDTTAGTIRFTCSVPVSSTVVLPFNGWPAAAANTNWTVQATGTSPNVVISARSVQLGA